MVFYTASDFGILYDFDFLEGVAEFGYITGIQKDYDLSADMPIVFVIA